MSSLHAINNIDVVSGGAGFIGSHLVDALLGAGRRVRVLDNFACGRISNLQHHQDNRDLEVITGDIGDKDVVSRALRGADRVFHLAALADIVPSIREPRSYFETNVDGTFNILEAAREHEIRRFVYSASSSCYGLPNKFPTSEDSSVSPQYPYALTKYLGEELVMHWAACYDFPAISLRLFNVFGPRHRTTGSYGAVFGVFLAQILAGKPLTVVGDGEQKRDFTYVSDVVSAFVAAANSDKTGEIYNVGSGECQSVNRLVDALGASETVQLPKRPGEPDMTFADITKIREELDWRPQVSFEDGVQRIMQHIDDWSDAPLWTVEGIDHATKDWFKYLGKRNAG
jgi:UDP-glucose 4-epimerase